jgi:nicotinate-nucleotide adenylyltransferase
MTARRRIGLVGGTFDPFHLGHLAVAHEARRALRLDEVRIVPARVPPHRTAQPRTSPAHRFAMVALGIADETGLLADDIELTAEGPSYTASTLARLQAHGFSAAQPFFVTGADAFAEIATWRDYPRVLDLAHFAVVSRPGRGVGTLRALLPSLAARMRDVNAPVDPANEDDPQPSILLIDVLTPTVSATRVRALAAARQPLTGLVPPLVADYITKQHLYDSPSSAPSPAAGPLEAASPLHEQEPV